MHEADFAEWAKAEVARLRADADRMRLEADALERALARYPAAARSPAKPPRPQGPGVVFGAASAPPRTRRGSKHDAVMAAWAEASASTGPLSIEDMVQIAATVGSDIDRHNIRSLVFHWKTRGRVTPAGDGYIWNRPPGWEATKTEAPEPQGSGAPS